MVGASPFFWLSTWPYFWLRASLYSKYEDYEVRKYEVNWITTPEINLYLPFRMHDTYGIHIKIFHNFPIFLNKKIVYNKRQLRSKGWGSREFQFPISAANVNFQFISYVAFYVNAANSRYCGQRWDRSFESGIARVHNSGTRYKTSAIYWNNSVTVCITNSDGIIARCML